MSSRGTSIDDVILSKGFAVHEIDGEFQLWDVPRRPVSPNDVLIRILYCGICHG
jgi:D-arabinose 1-dehydrogenase-like Zn-dependent alcohol dehydrogenase